MTKHKHVRLDEHAYNYLAWRAEQNDKPIAAELRDVVVAIARTDAAYLAVSGETFGAQPVDVGAALSLASRAGRTGRPPGTAMTPVKGWVGVFLYGGNYRAKYGRTTLGTFASPAEAAAAYDNEARNNRTGSFVEVNLPRPESTEVLHPYRLGCYCPVVDLINGAKHAAGCPGAGKTWYDERAKQQHREPAAAPYDKETEG